MVPAALKRYFLSGILVVVPIILTYIVLRFLFTTIDDILQPTLEHFLGYYLPGLGLVTTLLLILLAGVVTRSYVGHKLYQLGDRLLARLPIIRTVYMAAKQLLEAITGPSMESFKEVALVQYPRQGAWALCFISNRIAYQFRNDSGKYVSVFIPSTPTPISGMVILVPETDVISLTMTIEEAVKFLVSGGVASPALFQQRTGAPKGAKQEVSGEAG